MGWNAPGLEKANPVLGECISFMQFMVMAWLMARLIMIVCTDPAKSRHEQPVPILGLHFATGLIYLIAASAGYNLVFKQSLQSLQTLLAASGVLSLVLGFALRGLLSDIFSGIVLHLDSTLKAGDQLKFQHRAGEIEARLVSFDWRCTILYDADSNALIIPNSEFSQLRLLNLTRPTASSYYSVKIAVPVDHSHRHISAILTNAVNRAASDGKILSVPGSVVLVSEVAAGVVTYSIVYPLAPGQWRGGAKSTVLSYALDFLNAAGISVMPLSYQGTFAVDSSETLSDNFDLPKVRARVWSMVPFFSVLNHPELAFIAERTLVQRMPVGSDVIVSGQSGESMFVILEGRLKVQIPTPDGFLTVGALWPGDCFGEMSLFTGASRSATITAVDRVQLMEITKPTMLSLFEQNPSLMQSVAQVIEERVRQNQKKIAGLQEVDETPQERTSSILGKIMTFFKGVNPP